MPNGYRRKLARLGRHIQAQELILGLYPGQWMTLRYFSSMNERARRVLRFAADYGSSRGTASRVHCGSGPQRVSRRGTQPAVIETPSNLPETSLKGRSLGTSLRFQRATDSG
ncbi:hypothetical protein [Rhodospirillum sp. A1_3_36]|uniref:hypothetical protein n=1 Tax=Rhodospirillum sp. A1_3_36 TaxID=3391666 RepID=UPI0039A4C282